MLVWLVGICAVFARMIIGLVSARLLVNRCRPVSAGPIVTMASEVRRAMGVSIPVRLVMGDSTGRVVVPMAYGFLRPTVLLPDDAGAWPTDRLWVVLLHEMAHVRRGDWNAQTLARCICALYWFHPLVWLAAHRLRVESERACDDLVLSCDIAVPDYATHLLEIVQRLSTARRIWTGTVAMAHKSELKERLQAILAGLPGSEKYDASRPGCVYRPSRARSPHRSAVLRPVAAQPAAAQTRRAAPHPGSNDAPPPVLTGGEMTQGPFTLLDITSIDPRSGIINPAGIRPAPPALSIPITANEGGTGLWIRVRGRDRLPNHYARSRRATPYIPDRREDFNRE